MDARAAAVAALRTSRTTDAAWAEAQRLAPDATPDELKRALIDALDLLLVAPELALVLDELLTLRRAQEAGARAEDACKIVLDAMAPPVEQVEIVGSIRVEVQPPAVGPDTASQRGRAVADLTRSILMGCATESKLRDALARRLRALSAQLAEYQRWTARQRYDHLLDIAIGGVLEDRSAAAALAVLRTLDPGGARGAVTVERLPLIGADERLSMLHEVMRQAMARGDAAAVIATDARIREIEAPTGAARRMSEDEARAELERLRAEQG